jgi:hypothetical protein
MNHTLISFHTTDDYYARGGAALVARCVELGVPHRVVPIAPTGSWVGVTRTKPRFILDQLLDLGTPVLWADADNALLRDTAAFDQYPGHDIVAAGVEASRAARWMPPGCRLDSSAVWFNATDAARAFLADPEAQDLFAVRHRTTVSKLVLVEGCA